MPYLHFVDTQSSHNFQVAKQPCDGHHHVADFDTCLFGISILCHLGDEYRRKPVANAVVAVVQIIIFIFFSFHLGQTLFHSASQRAMLANVECDQFGGWIEFFNYCL